jgi:hypothetical protein
MGSDIGLLSARKLFNPVERTVIATIMSDKTLYKVMWLPAGREAGSGNGEVKNSKYG